MRINRISPAVLLGLVLCTSESQRSFAAGDGDGNESAPAIETAEEAATRDATYEARLAARAAADEGFFLGQNGDFKAARKKLNRAIELDAGFSPAYRLRAAASLKTGDWAAAIADLDRVITLDPNDAEIFNERGYARRHLGDLHGAQDDFDRCIALGTTLSLAYANRAEVEEMLGDHRDASADLVLAQSLAPAPSRPPEASATPHARKRQIHHDARGTRTSNNAKGTTQ